jgi:saccharopepsin
MGIKPATHAEQVFKAPYVADGSHPVPVSNFLNAQCTSIIQKQLRTATNSIRLL